MEWCGTSLNTDVDILQCTMTPIVCHAIDYSKGDHEEYLTGN